MIHLRDPFYPWDVPTLRRNFGEPLQENWMQYQEDRYTDMDGTFRYTRKQMVASQIAWFSFVLFAMWLAHIQKVSLPRHRPGQAARLEQPGPHGVVPSTDAPQIQPRHQKEARRTAEETSQSQARDCLRRKTRACKDTPQEHGHCAGDDWEYCGCLQWEAVHWR